MQPGHLSVRMDEPRERGRDEEDQGAGKAGAGQHDCMGLHPEFVVTRERIVGQRLLLLRRGKEVSEPTTLSTTICVCR